MRAALRYLPIPGKESLGLYPSVFDLDAKEYAPFEAGDQAEYMVIMLNKGDADIEAKAWGWTWYDYTNEVAQAAHELARPKISEVK